MEWAQLEQTFSKPRLSRYLKECGDDKGLAEMAYITNIRICEALIPSMSILEVALRNSMDRILRERFKKDDWFDDLLHDPFYKDIRSEITKAKRKGGKNENKVIAELNFGFWTKLLNKKYNNLWKNLRLAFPRCPKQERRRHIVSKKLNNIRVLRNRVSHHEPIWASACKIAFASEKSCNHLYFKKINHLWGEHLLA